MAIKKYEKAKPTPPIKIEIESKDFTEINKTLKEMALKKPEPIDITVTLKII